MSDRPEDRVAEVAAELAAGRPVVRAVIVKAWGSTPREVGADMLVRQDGALRGTIGGGCGEAEIYELALEMLSQGSGPGGLVRPTVRLSPDAERDLPDASMPALGAQGYLCHVDLTEDPEEGGDKVCGGRFDVMLHLLQPGQHAEQVATAQTILESGGQLCWTTLARGGEPGFWKQGETRLPLELRLDVRQDPVRQPQWTESPCGDPRFEEPMGQTMRLVIVGAGHIARPLCRLAAEVGYRVTVLDDRSDYARPELFPDAAEVVAADYAAELPRLASHPLTAVVLVTRGHKHDQDCLRLMAGQPLAYLGMIGSQRRIDAVYAELVEEGYSAEALRAVHAPVGLEIGAHTPAEIAVSILAQMIKVRRLPDLPARQAVDRKRRQRSLPSL